MANFLKRLFGGKPKVQFKELLANGGIILDVRTKAEFSGGHCPDAINISVQDLDKQLSKLKKKDQNIICCCASGVRSGAAVRLLKSKGYTNVYNGGGWKSLMGKIS